MARVTNTILEAGRAHSAGAQSPMVDLTKGGQNGVMLDYESIVSNSAYVKRNLIPILLEAPRGFSALPDPDVWIATLKNLVELQAQTIEGLNSTLTAEYVENPVGGAGEVQQDISNVTRERSIPSFTWPEKYGRAINKFFDAWLVNLIMDPETKIPRVVNVGTSVPSDLLPDYTGMTMLFIEPDPTHTSVVEAWLCTNMMPITGGENVGRRDLTAAAEGVAQTIEFTAITQIGNTVTELAQRFLTDMALTGINPNNRDAFVEEVTADVGAVENGYVELVQRVSDQ